MSERTWDEIEKIFKRPFGQGEIDFLPKGKPNENGDILALPYIDARAVMNRLDEGAGPGNWSFDWTPMDSAGKAVKGVLTVCGVSRADVGEADQEAEPWKSGVSDALKRCGVHFGIFRYGYDLPKVWVKGKIHSSGGKERVTFADKNEPYRVLLKLTNGKQSATKIASQEAAESKTTAVTQGASGDVGACDWPGCAKAIKATAKYSLEQLIGWSREKCDGFVLCFDHKAGWMAGDRWQAECENCHSTFGPTVKAGDTTYTVGEWIKKSAAALGGIFCAKCSVARKAGNPVARKPQPEYQPGEEPVSAAMGLPAHGPIGV